jgi:hypothetical protein
MFKACICMALLMLVLLLLPHIHGFVGVNSIVIASYPVGIVITSNYVVLASKRLRCNNLQLYKHKL